MATETQTSPSLKYFGFVNTYSSKAWGISESYYTWGKTQLPSAIKTRLDSTEQQVTKIGDPYFKQLAGYYDVLIREADKRVDGFVQSSQGLKDNVQKQQESLFKLISDSLDKVKKDYPGATANVEKNLEAARGVPNVLSERAKQVQAKLLESYYQLLKDPRIQGVLDRTKPQVEQAQKQLLDAQSKVLAHERYAYVYKTVSSYVKYVQSSPYFKSVESRVAPIFNNVSQRFISAEQQSKIVDDFHKNTTPRVNNSVPVNTQ